MSVDPVMRAIVCRVPFFDFTIDALATATGLAQQRLAVTVNTLVQMGLLLWEKDDKGRMLITPRSKQARRFMAGWADDWCAGDDQCGVAP